jgi:F5/8 type C domain
MNVSVKRRKFEASFQLIFAVATCFLQLPNEVQAQVLMPQQIFKQETFWDNRDFDWYAENVPLFECPDKEITTTYYYRWDLLTKHLTYGSPNSGYSFTEFIDRPFWSGAYGSISCPAGFQLYEARWLKSPRIANDYTRYWLRTPGAQPRNYSTWLADSAVAIDLVHPNAQLLIDLLPDLIKNFEGWERRHFVPEVGLFWQTGHDDGMEFNINSRQTQDILRGAPSYRPSFNAYMWADAKAIAHIASLAGQSEISSRFLTKADAIKAKMIELMWDEKRQFFFPVLKNDEHRDGHQMKAMTRTYESGQFAGDPHGRELIGYVPWQFNMLKGDSRFDIAWKKLMAPDGFYADFGPSTVERNDPMFLLKKSCCWWSGQSWPYATTQTLKGLANNLQNNGKQLTLSNYCELLSIYARSHRKDGKPYLAEALHPDTGSFEGHDGYNHSEHYFHSGYCDLIITGLVGLVPRDDDHLELRPLAPSDWDFFALDAVPYRGHLLSVVWDKSGTRYQLGAGLHILVDGKVLSTRTALEPVLLKKVVPLKIAPENETRRAPINFAVNNDGHYFPRLTASFSAQGSSLAKLNDGNYWYLRHPPNRWTAESSPNDVDWIEVDLGVVREVHTVKLYVLDDRERTDSKVRAPQQIDLEFWDGTAWKSVETTKVMTAPEGHRPHIFAFSRVKLQKLRVKLSHEAEYRSGLSEIEVWGDSILPLEPVPPPSGNLAYNDGRREYPKATASHHDRFGGVPKSAIDGITNFLPTPTNRWTSYESKTPTDWLEIDFGKPTEFRRVDLAIYDDRGGVQTPLKYEIENWTGDSWQAIPNIKTSPEKPVGSQWNSAVFQPISSIKLRIVFTNAGNARSGVTEVMVWNE